MTFNPVGAVTLTMDGFFYGLGFSIALALIVVILDKIRGPQL